MGLDEKIKEEYNNSSEKRIKGVIEYRKNQFDYSKPDDLDNPGQVNRGDGGLLLPGFFVIMSRKYPKVVVLKKDKGIWRAYEHATDYDEAQWGSPLTSGHVIYGSKITKALTDPVTSENFQYAEISKKYQKDAIQMALQKYPFLNGFKFEYIGVEQDEPGYEESFIGYCGHEKYDFRTLENWVEQYPDAKLRLRGYNEIKTFVSKEIDTIPQMKWRVSWIDLVYRPATGAELVKKVTTRESRDVPLTEVLRIASQCIKDHLGNPYHGIKQFKRILKGKYCTSEV